MIACVGHTGMHAPQSMQTSSSQNAFPSSSMINALTGQTLMHASQPIHKSFSTLTGTENYLLNVTIISHWCTFSTYRFTRFHHDSFNVCCSIFIVYAKYYRTKHGWHVGWFVVGVLVFNNFR